MDARLVSPMLNDMEQLLKKFSEMYESTGVKILASFLWVGPLLFFSYFFSQFVATIPINVSTDPQISADAKSISLSNLSGTTVIFDSFSSEDEVSERLIPGNVQAYTHTKFSVHVSGVVSAILSPSTAPSYKFAKNNKRRLADTKRQKKQAPVVVKQEAEPTSPPCEDTIDLTMINDLHMQIMKQKQRCAMLFSDQRYEVSRVFLWLLRLALTRFVRRPPRNRLHLASSAVPGPDRIPSQAPRHRPLRSSRALLQWTRPPRRLCCRGSRRLGLRLAGGNRRRL